MHIHAKSSRECHREISGGPNVSQQPIYYHVERVPWQQLFISQLASWIFLGLDLEREASKHDTLKSQTTAAAEWEEHSYCRRLHGQQSEGRRRGGRSFVVSGTECIDYYFPQPISPLSHLNRAAERAQGVNYQTRRGSRNRSHLSKPRCLSCRTGRFPRD